MRFNGRVAGASLMVLLLALAVGCSPSKEIAPANGRVTIQILTDPAAGPRAGSAASFLWAKTNITAITFRAVDTGSEISLGGIPFQFLAAPVDVDLTLADAQSIASINLSPGTYTLDRIFINSFELNTSNAAPQVSRLSCADGVLVDGVFRPEGNGSLGIEPQIPFTFEVRSGHATTLQVLVNGTGLTTLLESHDGCESVGTGTSAATSVPLDDLSANVSIQLN
jgi:hypothetical protein